MNQVFKLKNSLVTIEIEPYTDKKDVNFSISYGTFNEEKTKIHTIFSLEDLKEINRVLRDVIKHCEVPEIPSSPFPNDVLFRKDLSDKL